jgi:UDP-2,3-diacylglucosamine hydrolase
MKDEPAKARFNESNAPNQDAAMIHPSSFAPHPSEGSTPKPDSTIAKEPIGLLAGWGRLPIVIAQKARDLGIPVVCVGIRGMADKSCLAPIVHRFYWTRLASINRPIRCFKREGVRRWTMAGKVHKISIFRPFRLLTMLPDWRMFRFWFLRRRRSNSDDNLILGIIDEFAKDGLISTSALELCPELLVKPSILTKRKPTTSEERDITMGWEMAKEMGRLDVGQSVMVREQVVLAVEAIEGTDRAIQRAGELCHGRSFVVVKVAKPQQDMRFDVPTVGVSTIETMKRAGAKVLAIEAGKTILLDRDQTIDEADRNGISIVAL